MAVRVTDAPTMMEAFDTPSEMVVAVLELGSELESLEVVLPPEPQPATTVPTVPALKILSAARRSRGGHQSFSLGW